MDLKKLLPTDREAYIQCVRSLGGLLSAAMDEIANRDYSAEDKAKLMSRIEAGITTVANLRGDSGAFYVARPEGLGVYQSEMYAIEDALQSKLNTIKK